MSYSPANEVSSGRDRKVAEAGVQDEIPFMIIRLRVPNLLFISEKNISNTGK